MPHEQTTKGLYHSFWQNITLEDGITDQQSADDRDMATTSKYRTIYMKETVPPEKSEKENLQVNTGKIEQYAVKGDGDGAIVLAAWLAQNET